MNLYVLTPYLLFWGGVQLPSLVARLLMGPWDLFFESVATTVLEALGTTPAVEGPGTSDPLTAFAIWLALCEVLAAVLGLACYCAVLLVHAIAPDEPDSGDREHGQLWQ